VAAEGGGRYGVMTQPGRIRMSLEEFERLPEGPPFYDYIDGEAIEVNKPTGRHQDIEHETTHSLKSFVRPRGLGRVYHNIDVRLPMGNWVGPDIEFIASEHLDRYDEEKGDLYGAPDLAVEVTSPSTAGYDRVEKFEQYRRANVPWVWIVDQDSLAVEEYQWTADGYLRVGGALGGQVFRPRLFPDLELDVKALTGF
jgi:Uma2 family endonuclease